MPINFPTSPTLSDTYTFGGKKWVWNGTGWVLTASGDISPEQADAFLTLLGATATGKALLAATTAANARSIVDNLNPAFSAVKSSAQTISNSTYTKITFPTEEYDYGGLYDAANSKFTPNVAGIYSVKAGISLGTTSGLTRGVVVIYKNGGVFKSLIDISVLAYKLAGAVDVYLNGTTDYIEAWAWLAATTPSIDGGAASFFQAHLVRA